MSEQTAPSTDGATATPKAPAKADRRTTWGVGAVVVVALVALFWPRQEGPKEVPAATVIDDQGHPVDLAERMAPVSLVHFWSTWCVGCLDEVPEILRLERDLAADPGLNLVMVAVSDDRRAVEEFVTSQADRSYVLHDGDWTVAKKFGTDKLPETHLVVDGLIVDTFVGVVDWDDPAVRARIRAKVAEARAAAERG